jgi:deoxyribodipyrimidine photo-lyase
MILERFSGGREQVAGRVAGALAGLYRESAEEAKPSPRPGGRMAAWEALEKFSVQGYANTRNKIHGNVSHLSCYIRHGVLGLREVAESVRDRFGRSYDSLKFWQELGWRQFWRLVYRRVGNGIYEDLEPAKVNLGDSQSEELPEEIQQGRTGLVCMDESVRELVETGYMHNHARMWFASFVVHFRKLGWKAGERFFYRHLLDGDPASNALSWQWVASTFSHRPYLFNKENVQENGGKKWCERCRAKCPFDATYPELERRLFSP